VTKILQAVISLSHAIYTACLIVVDFMTAAITSGGLSVSDGAAEPAGNLLASWQCAIH
jgi:hypothetical protein